MNAKKEKPRSIISPMGWGSGAYVVHKQLESRIPGYRVTSYHPYWTLFPFALRMAAQTSGAELIHTNPDYGIFFHNKHAPMVITFHGYTLDPWMRSYSTWAQNIHCATDLKLFTSMTVQKAKVITAVSHFLAGIVREDLHISKDIRVIYNGVDENIFTPAVKSHPRGKEINVFFSGNLKMRKGAHWLPGIAQRLDKNIRIFYTQGLRGKNSLPSLSNLQSIGSIPFHSMPDRYREMDILLMPTVREGFGLSVAEAMACGLPVVASNCSSLPELVDQGKGGFLCPVGDVDEFANKINILAENPDLRKEMGEYNRAKVEKMFRLDQMIDNYRQLFDEIIT
jgi:L-malate glycosyltransferase